MIKYWDVIECEEAKVKVWLKINRGDKFLSGDEEYNGKPYTNYCLHLEGTAAIESMEIINLKTFLVEVLGAEIQ